MIISASYKTDIPTFYGEWFINRIRAGYCKMTNGYSGNSRTIDLRPEAVEGIVFWTKNIGPMLKYLPELKERGYAFYVQHTINNYPREIEEKVIDTQKVLASVTKLVDLFGPDVLIWRYDPIISTSLTRADWHLRNFEYLAEHLYTLTSEVVISFAQTYKKTQDNVDAAAQKHGFEWTASERVALNQKRELANQLAHCALYNKMEMKACTQPEFLEAGLITEARCVDVSRLERMSGRTISDIAQKGMRANCGCFANVDIGEYDTCPHGCVYCYATKSREVAVKRYKEHNPESEFLYEPTGRPQTITMR